jgi:hypothetical protein
MNEGILVVLVVVKMGSMVSMTMKPLSCTVAGPNLRAKLYLIRKHPDRRTIIYCHELSIPFDNIYIYVGNRSFIVLPQPSDPLRSPARRQAGRFVSAAVRPSVENPTNFDATSLNGVTRSLNS